MSDDSKPCPVCGETIKAAAIKCRFCNTDLVEYESAQDGLPDARHERHFAPTDGGFRYRLVVEYAPRPGVKGLYDRLLVRRGVDRALRRTIENLERAFPR